ncbi:MAG: sensor histidine kinase, partial [Planktothrix sp.]
DLELLSRDSQRIKYFPKGIISNPEVLIQGVIANKIRENSQNHHEFYFEIEKLTLNIPEEIFTKIIEELIDNAVKFSDIGEPIHVKGHKVMNGYCLEFINLGRGMTAEQISKIGAYQQFERDIYEQQGSGLGLILVKRLVQLYQGEINIESTPGKTTIVKVFLSVIPN